MLDLNISNLHISQTSAASGVLIADVTSSDMSGKKTQSDGVEFATLDLSGFSVQGDAITVAAAPAVLTAAGAIAFAGFYEAGTALDPMAFTMQLGGVADCQTLGAETQGGNSLVPVSATEKLANTGAEGMGVLAGSAALMLLLGALVVAATRRRVCR